MRGERLSFSKLKGWGGGWGGRGQFQREQKSMVVYMTLVPSKSPVAKFLMPDWGDKVDTGIGLSYRQPM
jgi:hypothetical protein